MSYTPGPWKIMYWDLICDRDNRRIATVDSESPLRISINSNCSLLATAPELLQALKDCQDHIRWLIDHEALERYFPYEDAMRKRTQLLDCFKANKRAIEKAEGKCS